MLATLLESRAPRPRRAGGTALSLLVHGAVIAGAVALTATRTSSATAAPRDPHPHVTWTVPAAPIPAPARATAHGAAGPSLPQLPARTVIDVDGIVPPTLPPIDAGAPVLRDDDVVLGHGGIRRVGDGGAVVTGRGVGGGVVGERDVDRVPTVLGAAPTPRYPDGLRGAGITGRVLVQFVVDTLGRAERDVEILEATRPEFAEAVRAVLPRFRFSAGEADGRKVRTRVQVPFDFTLR